MSSRKEIFWARVGVGLVVGSAALLTSYYFGYQSGFYHGENPLVGVVQVTPIVATPTPSGGMTFVPGHETLNHDDVLVEVNEARLANGKQQYANNQLLDFEALYDATESCKAGSISHSYFQDDQSKNLFDGFKQVAEDINQGFSTAPDSINGFLESPTHRDILLSDSFNQVGVGVYQDCVSLIMGR